MRLAKIEAWALDVVAQVQSNRKVEDSRIELKREWPDKQKAARRIAAHANSSFGSDVLWIIGMDEDQGVVGTNPEDLANWWPGACSHFDGITPTLVDLVLSVNGKSLVCLLFETSRPPYVVKNPAFGGSGGGAVSLEVPWREGTSVRTATRNDLVRMLVSTISRPEIEILSGSGSLTAAAKVYPSNENAGVRLSFGMTIYLCPRSEGIVAIPFHKCRSLLSDGSNSFDGFELTMYRPNSWRMQGGHSPDSVTMERTSSELIANGPGKCTISVNAVLTQELEWLKNNPLSLRITLFVIDSELPVELLIFFEPEESKGHALRSWSIQKKRPGDP